MLMTVTEDIRGGKSYRQPDESVMFSAILFLLLACSITIACLAVNTGGLRPYVSYGAIVSLFFCMSVSIMIHHIMIVFNKIKFYFCYKFGKTDIMRQRTGSGKKKLT